MDSWTLQGDSYSFLRSAPRTFSLRHRDGTPNHVEIFDITNIPSHRSAISETTCLCDIFGDDCESPSLSSSPASGSFVHHHREVDGRAAASPLVDELNDSSGSYHTATGSSEGEETFEDSSEKLQSPTLQRGNSERRQTESQGLSSGHPGPSRDNSPRVEPSSTPPISHSTGGSLPEALKPTCSNRTPSPGYASPCTPSSEGRISSLSSSSADTTSSLPAPNRRHTPSSAELRSISPRSGDRHSYASHPSSTPTPSPEPKSRANSSSSESVNTRSLPESRGAQLSPEPRNASRNHESTPSPESLSKGYSPDLTSSTFNPRVIVSSCSPSVSSAAISAQSREVSVSPELTNRSYSPDTQSSSPFPELRGRVSLPDLFSRGSTPDIEESPYTPEPIPQPTSPGRDATPTPENQAGGSSTEPCSAGSTPDPTYTPPPPVTSLAPTPELSRDSVSPPSPGSLSSASPTKTWTRTPSPVHSPDLTYTPPPSEIRPWASSPAVSYSSAPSPEVRCNYSPVEPRHTAASPEIRITASSLEVREPSPEVNLAFNSLDLHLNSASPYHRSLASSPHITGISYSVVQPEDRDATVFPELSGLSTPEHSRTRLSPESRSPSPRRDSRRSSVAESTNTPRGSPHITGVTCTVLQSENSETTQSPRPRYQAPSPQRKHQTPSPEVNHPPPSPEQRYQTPSSERYQTPSPKPRSSDLSPVASSPEPRCNPCSPVAPSPVVDLQNTHPSPQLRNTPEVEAIPSDIIGIQYSTHSIEDRVSASFEFNTAAKSPVIDIRNNSPVVKSPVCSPQPRTSTFSAEEKGFDSSLEQNNTDRIITQKEINHQYSPSLASLSEEKQEEEFPNHYSPCELQTPSSNPPALGRLRGRSPNKSPAHKAAAIPPVQREEDPHPKYPTYSLTPDNRESNTSLKSTYTPESSGREPSPKASSGIRERPIQVMAHHVNRQTPSPPLTRFTPVHIIAPDKPYRQWQNRSHSPSQVACPAASNIKKPVTTRGSTDVADSNSQAHWAMLEREMEMEREREKERERQREREMERERKREERALGKGEGRQGEASYRGQQVELSFSARNRKGPASRTTAPTSRETRQGMPTASSYSETLLATRQIQQQQSLIRAQASQQDSRGGGTTRRLQHTVPRNRSTAPGRVAANRPRQSSSSSMGSELDDADDEVKWFTDLAFRSLSSPEVDYLDMYNSSHHSSTNISQPSTQESPAGANAAWMSYADLRGSAPQLDNEDFPFHQPSTYYSDGLDPSKRYEMGSFECVDVAVEREETRKVRRGVPKRQIQLKRKNNAETKQDESSENSSPVVPTIDSPSLQRRSKETLVRQHSTPATMQDPYQLEPSPEPIEKNERKSKLQKSASLDETCTKTKMATCLIKSVLSKKMQSVDKQTDRQEREEADPASENKTPPPNSVVAPLKESSNMYSHNRSSSLHSDHSLSLEDLAVRGEPSPRGKVKQQNTFGVKSTSSPSPNTTDASLTSPQTDIERTDPQSRRPQTSEQPEMRSELMVSFDSKKSTPERNNPRTGGERADDSKRWKEREGGGDSANATARNTGPAAAAAATGASGTQDRMTNRERECELLGTQDRMTNRERECELLGTEDRMTNRERECELLGTQDRMTNRERECELLGTQDRMTNRERECELLGTQDRMTNRERECELLGTQDRMTNRERECELLGTQDQMTNRERECELLGTEDRKQLRDSERSMYMSRTPEITLKASPSPVEKKKKTSLNVSLTPEMENKPELQREAASPDVPLREREEERSEARVDARTEEEEGGGNNKAKVPIHKVRDVRRLVKNTYNLSFKATGAAMSSLEREEKAENKMEEKKEMREETKEERREENIEENREERWEGLTEEMSQERTEELREERKEERKVEMKESKFQTFSPSPQRKGQPLSRPQPMQIQCKAVSWKENKSKMTPSKTDPETLTDKTQASPSQLFTESAKEPDNSSHMNSQSYTAVEAPTAKPCQPDTDTETEMLNAEMKTVPDNEEKPEVIRRDKKPPKLGSLPKVPSKDREVSTAVVAIKDGSSKAKTSASPAHDETPPPAQAPSTSPSPGPTSNTTPGVSSHSVSLFVKEKGYHADIGAVVGEGQSEARGKGVPRKHVNRLEIPLQTCAASDGGLTESRRERTFSSSSSQSVSAAASSNVQPAVKSGPTVVSDNTENPTKNREEERVSTKPPVKDTRQNTVSPLRNTQQQTQSQLKQKEQGDFEAVKRHDPTFPPKSPALRRFRPQPIEVRSTSKDTQKQETTVNNNKNRPQTIEVKSIANNSQKPVVPPKPNYKFKPADLGSVPNETQKPAEVTSSVKPHFEDRPQTIVVSSPTIYRKLSNETSSTSNYTRKLAVSAVSSYKPPPSKTATAVSSLSNRSTALSETEGSNDRTQLQQPGGASPQSTNYTQRPTILDAATAPGPIPALAATQAPGPATVSGPASAVANQSSQPAAADLSSHPQYPRTTYPQEQVMPVTSSNAKQSAIVSTTQAPGYTHTRHPYHRSLSNERSQRADDLRFYASDDPPSYDERESFSPLMLPDLTHRKPNRYHPSSRGPPCSCTSGCPSHPSLTPPHHHHSPHNILPPAPSHSPGQALPYPMAQPPLRPHQCRPEPQPMSYQPSSPKSSPLGPSQPPAMYQPLHQPPVCPPHPPVMQPCPGDRPLQPPQHMDLRRPSVHRSPQQQPPGVGGGPYSDHSHSHSPNLPPMDPQYLCGPQSLGPSYGSDYGGDSSSLYSDNSYGQTPRRVLLDPETGKYFYIEVPMQPLRKMLFDPETGQYVEVLIPQQAMSHSGLYPPSAAPYPPLHNPNMYAPPPQYLPYAAPPPQAHPQPPHHPEAPAPGTMHQNGPGVSYGSPSGQGPKPKPQNHPPLDQSYLESMYYVPTGMNASPNPTPPDCYHKHPPSLPNAGGKRS